MQSQQLLITVPSFPAPTALKREDSNASSNVPPTAAGGTTHNPKRKVSSISISESSDHGGDAGPNDDMAQQGIAQGFERNQIQSVPVTWFLPCETDRQIFH